jgi:hypothetical protein
VREPDVVNGVFVVLEELAALVEQLTRARLQGDVDPELLVSALTCVLAGDPIDRFVSIDGEPERGAAGVGQWVRRACVMP